MEYMAGFVSHGYYCPKPLGGSWRVLWAVFLYAATINVASVICTHAHPLIAIILFGLVCFYGWGPHVMYLLSKEDWRNIDIRRGILYTKRVRILEVLGRLSLREGAWIMLPYVASGISLPVMYFATYWAGDDKAWTYFRIGLSLHLLSCTRFMWTKVAVIMVPNYDQQKLSSSV